MPKGMMIVDQAVNAGKLFYNPGIFLCKSRRKIGEGNAFLTCDWNLSKNLGVTRKNGFLLGGILCQVVEFRHAFIHCGRIDYLNISKILEGKETELSPAQKRQWSKFHY